MSKQSGTRSPGVVLVLGSAVVVGATALGFQLLTAAPATHGVSLTTDPAATAQASDPGGQSFTEADIKKLGIEMAKSDFPVNGQGQTYGSMELSTTLDTMPDLVAVVGDNGYEGFVEKHHLVEPQPRNPGEARQIERAMRASLPGPVPVYAIDGKTQLDVFTPFVTGTGASGR